MIPCSLLVLIHTKMNCYPLNKSSGTLHIYWAFLASQTPYGLHFLWSSSNDDSFPVLIMKIQNGICMNNTDYNNGRAR